MLGNLRSVSGQRITCAHDVCLVHVACMHGALDFCTLADWQPEFELPPQV